VKPGTKALIKLKTKYSKNPDDRGVALVKKLLLSVSPWWLVVWVLRKYFVKSDYKAARESTKFFQLSNQAYCEKKMRQSRQFLSIALQLLGDKVPESYILLLHSAVANTLRDPKHRTSFSNSILSATEEIPAQNFDATKWYQLSRGLFSLGYFRAAWVARENSLDSSILEATAPEASDTALKRGMEAYLERGEVNQVILSLKNNSDRFKKVLSNEYKVFISLVDHVFHDGNEPLFGETVDRRAFASLITDRTVAMVGPAKIHGNFGNEIDSNETIVRIKFAGVDNLDDKIIGGERCDVNYYGNSEIRALANSIDQVLADTCLGPPMITLSWQYESDILERFIVLNLSFVGPLYRTQPTAGIRTLFTVLALRPKKVLLYGFDFYASEKQYTEKLISFLKEKAQILGHSKQTAKIMGSHESAYRSRGFTSHDPVSNFCFAQNLYKAGLFEIEPYGKSILELTPYQYVERLEEMLGDW